MSGTNEQAMELAVQIKGEIVSSNFPEFATALRNSIKGLNQVLNTDEEFGEAEQNVKSLKVAEKGIVEAKKLALEQAHDIQKLFTELDDISEEARQARLSLERSIKAKKEEVKQEIIEEAIASVDREPVADSHLLRITNSIKSKRTIESIRSSAEGEAKIINMELKASRDVISNFTQTHGTSIAPDLNDLELRSAKELNVELAHRVEHLKAEAEKKRMQAEHEKEQAKLRAEAEEAKQVAEEPQPTPVPRSKSGNTFDPRPATQTDTKTQPTAQANQPETGAEQEEFQEFCKLIVTQFSSIREARLKLKHQSNNQKALKFAEGVNALYTAMKGDV